MGTRHLIVVQIDGEYKIAQYGQWDGYPAGQGTTVLNFLKTADLEAFKSKLRRLRWLSDEECSAVDKIKNWPKAYPWLSRDAGAKILAMVADHETPLALGNSIIFAEDSLFCEWAYVIDFDTGVLEVWKGFKKDAVADGRFPAAIGENGYGPIQLKCSWRLDDLPSQEEFVGTADPSDAEEAA